MDGPERPPSTVFFQPHRSEFTSRGSFRPEEPAFSGMSTRVHHELILPSPFPFHVVPQSISRCPAVASTTPAASARRKLEGQLTALRSGGSVQADSDKGLRHRARSRGGESRRSFLRGEECLRRLTGLKAGMRTGLARRSQTQRLLTPVAQQQPSRFRPSKGVAFGRPRS